MKLNSLTLFRGPVLLCLSLLPPIVAMLRIVLLIEMSATLLITITFLSVGLFYTISDYSTLISSQLKFSQEKMHMLFSKIVLDSTLQDLCSLDASVGLLGSVVATFVSLVSLVGVYNYPLTKEQRAQLIQTILPSDVDVMHFLYTPGGFWKYLLPENKWREIIVGNDNSSNDLEVDLHIDTDVNIGEKHTETTRGAYVQNETRLFEFHDLSFESYSAIEDKTIQTETELDSLIEVRTSSRVKSPLIVSTPVPETNSDSNCDRHHTDTQDTVIMDSHQPSSSQQQQVIETNNNVALSNDPIEMVKMIATEKINCTLRERLFQRIKNDQLYHVIKITSLLLMFQLKYSKAARKTLWKFLNASITCGLLSAFVTSIGTLAIKKQFMEVDILKSRNHRCDGYHHHEDSSHSNKDTHTHFCLHCVRYENVLCRKMNMIFSDSLFSIFKDKKVKRKWQVVLAALTIYLFRKRRERRKIL